MFRRDLRVSDRLGLEFALRDLEFPFSPCTYANFRGVGHYYFNSPALRDAASSISLRPFMIHCVNP
jgi:hypothetical protein